MRRRDLLARLLLVAAAGCGGSDAGSVAQRGPAAGASAGAAGASAGAAGASAGAAGASAGAAGGPACSADQMATPTQICFKPDGTTREPITYPTGAAMLATYPACPALERAATDPCPSAGAVCNWSACGLKQVLAGGTATQEGDACCYAGVICYGADACGRPLLIDRRARVARVAASAAWC